MKYAFIRSHSNDFKITSMCRVLRVSRSGYYGWLGRPESRRSRENRQLLRAIREVHRKSREAYGAQRTWAALRLEGHSCGRHRVARLRRQANIVARRRRRFTQQRDYRRRAHIAPNLLAQKFDQASGPGRIWAGDVTFVATRRGWLYLAILIDLYSRKIIGWAMGARNNTELALSALEMATERQRPIPGLLHHTDQGSTYASGDYQQALKARQMRSSMSRPGNCYDNAVAESFFSSLKNELTFWQDYRTREQAKSAIFEYIEVFYNRQRLHQSLGYRTPLQAEMSAR